MKRHPSTRIENAADHASARRTKFAGEFTLIELLIVIAIMMILAALLLPVLSKVKKKAMIGISANNEKQIGTGIITHASENDQRYIRGRRWGFEYSWDDDLSEFLGTGLTEQEIKQGAPTDRPSFDILQCPLDNIKRTKGATRSYQLNSTSLGGSPRIFAYWGFETSLRTNQIGNPTGTILIVENAGIGNNVGIGGNTVTYHGGDINRVITSYGEDWNANHHDNGYRNPIFFADGHVSIEDMRTTPNDGWYLWKSKK